MRLAEMVFIGVIALFLCAAASTRNDEIDYATYMDVNTRIQDCINSGRADDVYEFYTKYTRDKAVASGMVNAALLNDIPVNLFFSVASAESEFYVGAVNKRNRNGSKDYGLFQLNSYSYKKYSKKYLMDYRNNTRLAAGHLAWNKDRTGGWVDAVMLYNCGNYGNIGKHTVKYLAKIITRMDGMDKEFNSLMR